MAKKELEVKKLGGYAVEVKQEEINGVQVGLISGYIATWDIDRGNYAYKDQFIKGAFADSIEDFKERQRMPRFKDSHYKTIGGWRYETLREDSKGLFGVAEVNLDVQQGKEAYMMAKQGVLTDFSVGFTAEEYKIDETRKLRQIQKAILWEGSIVDEPMNPQATITDVKNDQQIIHRDEAKKLTERDFEELLTKGSKFTNNASKTIISLIKTGWDAQELEQRDAEEAIRINEKMDNLLNIMEKN